MRRLFSRLSCVAFSLVLTRKEPMMEQMMPHTASATGSSMPFQP